MTSLSGEKADIMISQRKNLDSADVLKFVLSVLIVATHTSFLEGYLTPLVRLAVPAFFMISGYFFFSRINSCDSKEKKKAYLKKSVIHNLKLYLFWFVILLPLTLYIRKYHTMGIVGGLTHLIRDFLFGSTFQSSWYIIALITGFTIVMFLSYKLPQYALVIIGVILYIPSLLSSNYEFLVESSETLSFISDSLSKVFLLPCRNFSVSILYIAIGKYLAEKNYEGKTKKYTLTFLLAFAALVAEYFMLNFGRVKIEDTDCYIALPFAAYYLCKVFLTLDINCKYAIILRKISTVSYCAHMAVFMVVGKCFKIFEIPDWRNILHFVVTLILTHILSLVLIKLTDYKCFRFLKYSH